MLRRLLPVFALAGLALLAGLPLASAAESDLLGTLKEGGVQLKSAGALAFAPQGILLVGDNAAAAIYAVDTGDRTSATSTTGPKVEGLKDKIATLLDTEGKEIDVRDLAVNPISGNAYLSVSRGRGTDARAVIVRVTPDGKLSELSLKDAKSARTSLPDSAGGKAPAKTAGKGRGGPPEVITHMAYLKGRVYVAGMSSEEFVSKLRSIPFPFDKTDPGTNIKIFHGAHGKWETQSPVRVFAPYQIGGEDNLLAAYQCTPLVKLPVSQLKPGEQLVGTTVAELGNRNRPLSIVVYKKDGKDYALIANSSRGLMKVGLEGVDSVKGITEQVRGTAGLKYETVKGVTGVQKIDAMGKDHVVMLISNEGGRLDLKTTDLP